MIHISFNEKYESFSSSSLLETTAQAVLSRYTSTPVDLTIAIEDDQELRNLNRDFLGSDSPTDVLSFLAQEIDPETGSMYLGDVVISYERALAQAASAGHSLISEIQLLIIHGVLHLLGFDHASEVEKKAMWSIQSELIRDLKIEINALPED